MPNHKQKVINLKPRNYEKSFFIGIALNLYVQCSKEDPTSSDPSQEAVKFEIGAIDGQRLYARGTSITVEELPSKS